MTLNVAKNLLVTERLGRARPFLPWIPRTLYNAGLLSKRQGRG